jgi:uncharacterized protein YndB with AHSA1/START domain
MKTRTLPASLLLALVSWPAHAAVLEVQPTLFVIESTATTKAAPATVYRALTRISGWWDPAHTWSGSAKNLSLDARAGGCWCEKLASGGSVQHARVIWAQPGKKMKLEGAFGPLQDMVVDALLTFTLEPDGAGTRIKLTFRSAGTFTMDSAKLAPGVDFVLGSQLKRLATFADGGVPAK